MRVPRSMAVGFLLVLMLAMLVLPGTAAAEGHGASAPAQACKHGGYVDFHGGDGVPFQNQGQCISYVATTGEAPPLLVPPSISIVFTPDPFNTFALCQATITLHDFPGGTYTVDVAGKQNIGEGNSVSFADTLPGVVVDGSTGTGSVIDGRRNRNIFEYQASVGAVASPVYNINQDCPSA